MNYIEWQSFHSRSTG